MQNKKIISNESIKKSFNVYIRLILFVFVDVTILKLLAKWVSNVYSMYRGGDVFVKNQIPVLWHEMWLKPKKKLVIRSRQTANETWQMQLNETNWVSTSVVQLVSVSNSTRLRVTVFESAKFLFVMNHGAWVYMNMYRASLLKYWNLWNLQTVYYLITNNNGILASYKTPHLAKTLFLININKI